MTPLNTQPTFTPTTPAKGHKKTAIILTIIGVVVLACLLGSIIAALAGGGSKPKSHLERQPATTAAASAPAAATTAAKAAGPGLGSKVRDGKFQFVATNLECGVDIPNVNPQGQYCSVDLAITNISKQPQYFFDVNQFAIGSKGEKYAADGTAGISANLKQAAIWSSQINPGNSISGKVVWDIPKAGKIVRFELHDSALSGGVKISATPAS